MREIDEFIDKYSEVPKPTVEECVRDANKLLNALDERLRRSKWYQLFVARPMRRIYDLIARRFTMKFSEHVKQLATMARDASTFLRYTDAPYRTTLATHDVCRSSRIFSHWTPDVRNVRVYYAYTIARDTEGRGAFPTAPAGSSTLNIISKYIRKWLGELYTTILELVDKLVDLIRDRIAISRTDDSKVRRTLPAYVATYLHHRILAIRAMLGGRREDADAMTHCSVYYLPAERPRRRKRGYKFTEACIGRLCVRRIRITTMEVVD
ncbi:MAG: hypothetical protein J7J22_04640 [Candidatus Verstraetearchaeota archaeon]|nr:hypothetical protein [Candidatus Verstraetearchaeota archaeon]